MLFSAEAYLYFMDFRLDRTAFHMGSHAETERYHARHEPTEPLERLRVAAYLTAAAYGYDPAHPPRLDRTAFSARRHGDADSAVSGPMDAS